MAAGTNVINGGQKCHRSRPKEEDTFCSSHPSSQPCHPFILHSRGAKWWSCSAAAVVVAAFRIQPLPTLLFFSSIQQDKNSQSNSTVPEDEVPSCLEATHAKGWPTRKKSLAFSRHFWCIFGSHLHRPINCWLAALFFLCPPNQTPAEARVGASKV